MSDAEGESTAADPTDPTDPAALVGAEVYSERVLRIYDVLVLLLTSAFIWRCPRGAITELHNRNLGARHLELGVGTGFFLDRAGFPVPRPEIELVDLNQSTLDYASARLARYTPGTRLANVLEPLDVPADSFDSVGLSLLLHCLPGEDMAAKAPAIANAARAAKPSGRVFGATVLAGGVRTNRAAEAMLRNHNERGILHNAGDTVDGLRAVLDAELTDVRLDVRGYIALFEGTAPGGSS